MFLALASVCGCAAPSIYAWGNYEELVYASYAAPESMPPESQIQQMEEDFQKAQAIKMRVPPGWHAHLGYLYAQVGKMDEAQRELLAEKSAYPESAVMMDSLLANLRRQ
jgi:hypothetical protein